MGDYLEGYGEQHSRRNKVLKWLLISVLILLVAGPILYLKFRDYPEERLASEFLRHLRAQDYKAAYALWGCTDATPCSQYPFEEFLKDWGPQGSYRDADRAHVVATKSCDTGIIRIVRFPGQPDALLWVDRQTDVLSFAPWRLRSVPPGFKHRLQEWMWDVTRNCKALIQ